MVSHVFRRFLFDADNLESGMAICALAMRCIHGSNCLCGSFERLKKSICSVKRFLLKALDCARIFS